MRNPASFITWVLVGVVMLFIYLNYKQYKIRERENFLIKNELIQTVDSISTELKYVREQRDSAFVVNDSLVVSGKAISAKLEETTKELKSIDGRFDKLTNRELELKMEEEWRKGR